MSDEKKTTPALHIFGKNTPHFKKFSQVAQHINDNSSRFQHQAIPTEDEGFLKRVLDKSLAQMLKNRLIDKKKDTTSKGEKEELEKKQSAARVYYDPRFIKKSEATTIIKYILKLKADDLDEPDNITAPTRYSDRNSDISYFTSLATHVVITGETNEYEYLDHEREIKPKTTSRHFISGTFPVPQSAELSQLIEKIRAYIEINCFVAAEKKRALTFMMPDAKFLSSLESSRVKTVQAVFFYELLDFTRNRGHFKKNRNQTTYEGLQAITLCMEDFQPNTAVLKKLKEEDEKFVLPFIISKGYEAKSVGIAANELNFSTLVTSECTINLIEEEEEEETALRCLEYVPVFSSKFNENLLKEKPIELIKLATESEEPLVSKGSNDVPDKLKQHVNTLLSSSESPLTSIDTTNQHGCIEISTTEKEVKILVHILSSLLESRFKLDPVIYTDETKTCFTLTREEFEIFMGKQLKTKNPLENQEQAIKKRIIDFLHAEKLKKDETVQFEGSTQGDYYLSVPSGKGYLFLYLLNNYCGIQGQGRLQVTQQHDYIKLSPAELLSLNHVFFYRSERKLPQIEHDDSKSYSTETLSSKCSLLEKLDMPKYLKEENKTQYKTLLNQLHQCFVSNENNKQSTEMAQLLDLLLSTLKTPKENLALLESQLLACVFLAKKMHHQSSQGKKIAGIVMGIVSIVGISIGATLITGLININHLFDFSLLSMNAGTTMGVGVIFLAVLLGATGTYLFFHKSAESPLKKTLALSNFLQKEYVAANEPDIINSETHLVSCK